jgi:hypothetical protein
MRTLLLVVGLLILGYVVLGLIAGLAPVDGWGFILDLFNEQQITNTYRVVASDSDSETTQIIVLTVAGLLLIALSRAKIFKKNS